MKSLHVIPAVAERYGGPSKAIYDMCRSLRSVGCECTVCTTDADGSSRLPVELGKFQSYNSVPTIFFKRQFSEALKYSMPLAKWLRANVRGFDVVHIHSVFSHACVAAARECRRQNVPYIVRPLGTLDPWGLEQKKLRKKIFFMLAVQSMLDNAAAIHYTAVAERNAVEENIRCAAGTVIPLGVDLEQFQNNGIANSERPYSPESPYILFLSRLHPKKGLEVLIDAFLALCNRAEFQNWRVVIAGDGDEGYLQLLKRRIAAQTGEEKITFVGWLSGDSKLRALRGCEMLALPSYQENFGICLLEAMATGIPVLISSQLDLSSEIDQANAGWIAPLNASGFSAALTNAMIDVEGRKRKGLAARTFAQRFASPIVAEQLLTLYKSIVSNRGLKVANA